MKTYSIDNNRELMDEIIRKCMICNVGLSSENTPYVIPMNFGYENGVIYLHSAPEGSSIKIINKNPKACITFCSDASVVYQNEEVACSYRMKGGSVICRGNVEFIDDLNEKETALNCIMKQYSGLQFSYSVPALKNVKVWKVDVEQITGKIFGEKHNLSF